MLGFVSNDNINLISADIKLYHVISPSSLNVVSNKLTHCKVCRIMTSLNKYKFTDFVLILRIFFQSLGVRIIIVDWYFWTVQFFSKKYHII